MNGQLLLLLLSMLLQNPNSEVLPQPIRNGAGIGGNGAGFGNGAGIGGNGAGFGNDSAILPGNPVSAPTVVSPPVRGTPQVGYGSDPLDGNKFCLIIQIPPENLGEFARGPAGQELPVSVPDEIRNYRIDRVIVRVGTAPVERNLPNVSALSDNRQISGAPQIIDLNNLSPVFIDKTRPQSNLANVAQNGAGFAGSATMANNTNPAYYSNDGGTSLPVLPNSPNDRSRPISTVGNGSNGLDSSFNSPLNNPANASRQDVLPGQNTTQGRDGFIAKSSPFNSLLVPNQNNQTNPSYASSTYPYSSGNSTNSSNLGPNNNRQFNVASNATNPPPYFDNQIGQQNSQQLPQSGYMPTPSTALANQYGPPVALQPSYGGLNPYVATQTGGFQLSPQPITKTYEPPPDPLEETQIPKDKLLPFLLLLSIVVNVYLGFWMNYLRTRYRELCSNMRGIPVSDLA